MEKQSLPLPSCHGNLPTALKKDVTDLPGKFRKSFPNTLFRQVSGVKAHAAVDIISHGLGHGKAFCHHHCSNGNPGPFVKIRGKNHPLNPGLLPLEKCCLQSQPLQCVLQGCHLMKFRLRIFVRRSIFWQITGYIMLPVLKRDFIYHALAQTSVTECCPA